MAFDPDAYLAAKTGGEEPPAPSGFDPDAYLEAKGAAPARVDVGPAARRAAAGLSPGPRDLTAEEAGTSPSLITARSPLSPTSEVARGPLSLRQKPAPADLPPDQVVSIGARYPGSGHGHFYENHNPFAGTGPAKSIWAGHEHGEMDDPGAQLITANALGMAAGAPAGATLEALGAPAAAARLAAAGTEGAVASKAAGGDAATGAALGIAPFIAAPAARAVTAPARAIASKLAPDATKAIKNARGWVAKDIAGEIKGASTATARKQLADDAEHVSTLVLKDRDLDSAINAARAGDVDKVQAANGIVKDRLKTIAKERIAPKWAAADKVLPNGGVRTGDLDAFLATRSGELRATGIPSHVAEADALDGIRNNLRNAKEWGGGVRYDPKAKVKGGALDGMDTDRAIELLEKQKTGPTASVLNDEIKRLRADATVAGFDPSTVVPAQQVQKLWSDVAGNAYKSYGGINGTAAFERKLDVASHIREFRDDVIADIAEQNPRIAGELRDANRDFSALKRVEKVLDQRLNHAKANAQGASVPAGLVHTAKKLKHDPLGFALGLAPDAAIAAKRWYDRAIARNALDAEQAAAAKQIFAAPPGRRGPAIRAAVAAGVPAALARSAAQAAEEQQQ